MFWVLPGGSPGPGAECSFKGLLFVFLLALIVAGGIFAMIIYAADF